MKTTQINRIGSTFRNTPDLIYFYNLYFIAQQAEYRSWVSYSLFQLETRQKMSNLQAIEIYFAYIDDENAKEGEMTKEGALQIYKEVNRLNAIKHKSKYEILALHEGKSFLAEIKTDACQIMIDIMKLFNLWEWKDLFDNEAAIIYDDKQNYEQSKTDDPIIKFIFERITANNYFFLFEPGIENLMNSTLCTFDGQCETTANTDFLSIHLFKIPFCKALSKDQMKFTRNHLLNQFSALNEILEELKTSVQQQSFDDNVKDIATAFCYKIKPASDEFQKHIDEQLFFQQCINSTEDWFYSNMRIGICSLNTMIDCFLKTKVISPHLAGLLKRDLTHAGILNRCDVFIYFDLPEKVKEENYELNYEDMGKYGLIKKQPEQRQSNQE